MIDANVFMFWIHTTYTYERALAYVSIVRVNI